MRTWFEDMKDHHDAFMEESRERQAAKDAEQRRGFALRHTPMTQRIMKLIEAMPDDERHKPRSMSFFTAAMRAKYPSRGVGRASPAEIGPALRALGWTRERKWRADESGFRALWIPPTTN